MSTPVKTPTKLVFRMLKHINKVYQILQPSEVDIEFLEPYQKMTDNFDTGDMAYMVDMGSKILYAYDLCKDAAVVARALVFVGESIVDQERAKSHLTRAPEYFVGHNIKSTDKMTVAFVDQDPICISAVDTLNQWKAIYDYFEKSRQSFENWHNWIKKICSEEMRTLLTSTSPRMAA